MVVKCFNVTGNQHDLNVAAIVKYVISVIVLFAWLCLVVSKLLIHLL